MLGGRVRTLTCKRMHKRRQQLNSTPTRHSNLVYEVAAEWNAARVVSESISEAACASNTNVTSGCI